MAVPQHIGSLKRQPEIIATCKGEKYNIQNKNFITYLDSKADLSELVN